MANVSNIVKSIQDIMRKDAGTYGDAQRLEQLGWMFLLKIFDDREKELDLLRDRYKSPLPKHLRWSHWAADEEGITGEPLLDFVNNTLLPKLKALTGGGDKIAGLIRMAFEDANNYMKNGTLMRQVINKINGIDFNASDDRHMFGDIYEKILKDLQSAGNAGEFYTPRAVTRFIVEQVNPRLGETILDPACGTGGFLTCAIEHLRKQSKTEADEQAIQDCFAGIEKKHLPHVLCMTNLLLHGIDVPASVRHDNTLARPLRDWSPRERAIGPSQGLQIHGGPRFRLHGPCRSSQFGARTVSCVRFSSFLKSASNVTRCSPSRMTAAASHASGMALAAKRCSMQIRRKIGHSAPRDGLSMPGMAARESTKPMASSTGVG